MKKVLISGGSNGIGRGIALYMASHGWEVAFTYNNHPEGAQATREMIESAGGVCHVIETHLQEEGAPEDMVKKACGMMGGLDAYVCNAGRDGRHSVLSTTRTEMQAILDTNFLGYMLSAGEAARWMVRHGVRGCIVFITSTRAVSAHPDDFLYGGIKAAVERASRSMALDLSRYGIRVNCVAPGATRVRDYQQLNVKPGDLVNGRPYWPIEDTIPMGRMGEPRDVAEAVAYLCGDGSSYVTGITLRVDGGLVLPGMPEWWAPCQWLNESWKEHAVQKMNEAFPDWGSSPEHSEETGETPDKGPAGKPKLPPDARIRC